MKTLPKSLHTVTAAGLLARHLVDTHAICDSDKAAARERAVARALEILGYAGAGDPYELAAKTLRIWNAEAIAPQRAKAKAALEELALDLDGRALLAEPRRDNVEFYQGRDARRAGTAADQNPYSPSSDPDSRHARWALGWAELELA